MTEAKETDVRRGTIFGREAINRNDLLKALVVDGQDKVRLDDIQNYVNKSQKQAQHLGWYKFAALFGFIIIILQALTTFGVVLWGDAATRQLYATDDGHMVTSDGSQVDAMGAKSLEMMPDEDSIYKLLWLGYEPGMLRDFTLQDEEGNDVAFNFDIAGMSKTGGVFTLYTTNGYTIEVTAEGVTMVIGDETYYYDDISGGERRRLGNMMSAPQFYMKKASGGAGCGSSDAWGDLSVAKRVVKCTELWSVCAKGGKDGMGEISSCCDPDAKQLGRRQGVCNDPVGTCQHEDVLECEAMPTMEEYRSCVMTMGYSQFKEKKKYCRKKLGVKRNYAVHDKPKCDETPECTWVPGSSKVGNPGRVTKASCEEAAGYWHVRTLEDLKGEGKCNDMDGFTQAQYCFCTQTS